MAYDWGAEADRDGKEKAEQLPAGTHDVELVRVVFGGRGGSFKSSKGDHQIMCVFADVENREAAQMYTLSEKAGWALAKLLSAAGANVQRMTASGVKPQDFANADFAEKNLVGRKLRVQVDWDSKGYASITPVRKEAVADATANDDDIPF